MLRKAKRFLHHFLSIRRKLIPGTVKGSHQQITWTCALHQLQILRNPLQRSFPHTMVPDMQHGTLCQRSCNLVHTLHTDIRPRLKCAHRKLFVKIQMPAMRLIDQQQRSV